jgi:NADH:ubiquinone oxidoreductase subunit 6 (subunit J)
VVRHQAAVYFLWLAGLLGLVAIIGFIPAIALFIFAYMRLGFGEAPTRAAVCGMVTALLCWALFHQLLAVAWPQSLLGDVFPTLRAALGFV